MAVMRECEVKKMIREDQLKEMAQEGTPGEIACIEWYQKEDFKRGRMSKEEELRYLIRRGYEDATLDGYLASDEEIEKAIQAALVGLRIKETAEKSILFVVEQLGGMPMAVGKLLFDWFKIWKKK